MADATTLDRATYIKALGLYALAVEAAARQITIEAELKKLLGDDLGEFVCDFIWTSAQEGKDGFHKSLSIRNITPEI